MHSGGPSFVLMVYILKSNLNLYQDPLKKKWFILSGCPTSPLVDYLKGIILIWRKLYTNKENQNMIIYNSFQVEII